MGAQAEEGGAFPHQGIHVGRREREHPRLSPGLGCVCRSTKGRQLRDHRVRNRLLPTALPFSLTCSFNTHLLLLSLSMDDSRPQGAHRRLREVGLDTDAHKAL